LRDEIDRRVFASSVHLDIEFDSVAFIEPGKTRAFNRTDMNKRVRLAVIAGDEAETLHCVEELDGTDCLLAGELALLRRFAFLDGPNFPDNLQIAG